MHDIRRETNKRQESEGSQTVSRSPGLIVPSASLPKGGGAIRGMGEKFAANPVTGTGSMSIPIAISPGRAGFGPQFSLSYDSGSGNGPFGLGWSLSLPAITRKTDRGLPQYRDAEDSDVFVLSGTEDLVPEFRKGAITGEWVEDAEGNFVREEAPRDGYLVRRYRPRVEGLFSRLERWTSQSNPTDVFWRSISRDNITTWYGKTEKSRIADPSDPTRIFSWLICESYDDKGNNIVYEYLAENDSHVDRSQCNERNRSRIANRYLSRITYGNTPSRLADDFESAVQWHFEVLFDYGDGIYQEDLPDADGNVYAYVAKQPQSAATNWPGRSDPQSSYRSGFEIRTHRLCRRVLMFHRFDELLGEEPQLVRATEIQYAENPVATRVLAVAHSSFAPFTENPARPNERRYLKRTLPPLEFKYTEPVIDGTIRSVDSQSLENLPYGFDGANYQWVDLDGEGLSGILSEQGEGWFYKRNLAPINLEQDKDGNERARVRFTPVEFIGAKPNATIVGGAAQFIDLAGDGQLDLVMFDGPTPGFYTQDADEGWKSFRPFTSRLNRNTRDPNLRFVDIDGDGHADVLITEDEALTWHSSSGEAGFGPAQRVATVRDEEIGPALIFADGTQSIYLADMSGDGLSDLVRIRNGEICYWPNLGYGLFGAKVRMDHSPFFDAPDLFDQRRVHLADIDGSGVTDIIYLHDEGARLFFNESGNAWSSARDVPGFPRIDKLSSVAVVDLLGNGTACLVWCSTSPDNAREPMKKVDLMSGQKPHLLISVRNNLGATTTIDYAPSTRFYLQDKLAGKPWITRLPFPVHCVARISMFDKWRNTRFSSTYSYHHGYFDGVEREFRGFGRVEQVDVESFEKFANGNAASPYITDDQTLYQPPVKTIIWFHTGAAHDSRRILTEVQGEYFPNSLAALPGYSTHLSGFTEKPLPEPNLETQNLTADEWREAMRACKGMQLRQESYELDVDQLTEGKQIPVRLFSAATHNCRISLLQPKRSNHHAVFLVTENEALSYHYELDLRSITLPSDPQNVAALEPVPRVTHTLNLMFDDYGNVLQSVAIAYPRAKQFADAELTEHFDLIRGVQAEQHISYTETLYTNDAIEPITGFAIDQQYRLRLPAEVQTFELTGFHPAQGRYFDLSDFHQYGLSDRLSDQGATVVGKRAYHQLPTAGPEKRKVEHLVTLFFNDDLKNPLDHGVLNHLALVYENYKLALATDLLSAVFGAKFDTSVEAMLNDQVASGYTRGPQFPSADAGVEQWWIGSGVAGYADDASHRFYLPEKFKDPFGSVTTLVYDEKYHLFIASSTDALGNHTEIFVDPVTNTPRFDYRVLAPLEMQDINGNRTEVYFDVRGLVIAVAIKGKGVEADNLDGYNLAFANPGLSETLGLFNLPAQITESEARGQFHPVLRNATTRFLYHFGESIVNGEVTSEDRPAGSCAILRERHVASLPVDDPTGALQIAFECSDGAGTVLMKRSQAEPEMTAGPLRWIVSGKTILNNKGKPVKQYEPYFSTRAGCCAEGDVHEEVGVTSLMYYDAVGRLVRTEMPNGTFSRVDFSPWHVKTYDTNDTVLESRWYVDRGSPDRNSSEPAEPDARAAWLAIVHSDTPAQTHLDSLGREAITIAHNRVENGAGTFTHGSRLYKDQRYLTFTKLDAEGKRLWIRDVRGHLVMQYITPAKANNDTSDALPLDAAPCYDIAGNLLFQHSMDAGDRWMLMDAAGKPMLAWDFNERQKEDNSFTSEQRVYTTRYDLLHRPIETWLKVNTDSGRMIDRFEYQDALPLDSSNLNGQLVRHYDPSGRVEIVLRDFKGNVLETERRLNNQPTESLIDWQTDPESFLETESFSQISEFDALNRITRRYNWHRGPGSRVAVYEPAYNERGILKSETLRVRAVKEIGGFDETGSLLKNAIGEIRYNAKGQKTYLALGNGTLTEYEYDPKTFRLRQIFTTRPANSRPDSMRHSNLQDASVVQELNYTYDPVGNITECDDEAYEPVFFQNQEVEARSRYQYDALYRLIAATGRENGALRGAPANLEGSPVPTSFPITHTDPNALRNYTQTYLYDRVGNVERVRHEAGIGSWTRDYTYAFDNPLQPASNRLWQTWEAGVRTDATTYLHDTHGNMLNLVRTDPRFNMRWDHRDMIGSIDLGGGGRAFYQYDSSKQRTRKRIVRNGVIEERIYLGGYELYRRYKRTNPNVPVEEIESLHLFEGEERVLLIDDVITAGGSGDSRPDGLTINVQTLFRYQYSNHVGSACLELDDAAEIISYEEFHPYGTSAYRAMKQGIEVPLQRYRYTGMERDEESGLNYHGARYSASWLARWLSSDPIWSMALHGSLYEYGNGNPVCCWDPSGNAPIKKSAQLPAQAKLGDFQPHDDHGLRGPNLRSEHPAPEASIKEALRRISGDPEYVEAESKIMYGRTRTVITEKNVTSIKDPLDNSETARLKKQPSLDYYRDLVERPLERWNMASVQQGSKVDPALRQQASLEQGWETARRFLRADAYKRSLRLELPEETSAPASASAAGESLSAFKGVLRATGPFMLVYQATQTTPEVPVSTSTLAGADYDWDVLEWSAGLRKNKPASVVYRELQEANKVIEEAQKDAAYKAEWEARLRDYNAENAKVEAQRAAELRERCQIGISGGTP